MVYTIGYAGITLEKFLETMQKLNITLLIDVRSLPKSKYFYQFNDVILNKNLNAMGISYENWKNEFGARQDNLDFYQDGILSYDIFSKSEQFQNGIKKIKSLQKQDKNICLMCSEIDPINCHRAILCGRFIAKENIEVRHIIARRDGRISIENHVDFEKRLIEQTKIDNLDMAYQKINKKIGYKLTYEQVKLAIK